MVRPTTNTTRCEPVTPALPSVVYLPCVVCRLLHRGGIYPVRTTGLTKLLAENAPKAMKAQIFESYFGREIAIDASMSIYQFLIVVGRRGTLTLTNEAGEVTSHLQGMLTRTIRLLEAGIKPVYVFDGTPPNLKKEELAKRFLKRADAMKDLNDALKNGNKEDIEKFSKRTVKATDKHYEDCKKLLRLMGVPVIEAPCEAESQCAALCKAGKVYAVASEDMDSLAFGAPRLLRHFMDPTSKRIPVVEFEVLKVLEGLNLTMDQFIDLCILSGCDYCESIRGIGGLTALKLIRQHGSLEHIIENINKERYQIPVDWPYQETRKLFREPSVLTDNDQLDIKWADPDEEGLVRFLVNENNFSRDRITKALKKTKTAMGKLSGTWLESYSEPVGASVTAKGKVARCSLAAPQRAIKPMKLPLGASCGSRPKAVVCTSLPVAVDMHTNTKHSMQIYRSVCLISCSAKATMKLIR
ncbi:5'-3' exonuclease family protein [Perilla frutescens var. frutescens]|nr:5'-3' exonuclease family protein [Perilla frutescens var. frutescens]